MKKPVLKFERLMYVPSWATEIVEGWGTPFEYIQGISHYSNTFLFYRDNEPIPIVVYQKEIFSDRRLAEVELHKQRLDRKKYYERIKDEAIEKLKTL